MNGLGVQTMSHEATRPDFQSRDRQAGVALNRTSGQMVTGLSAVPSLPITGEVNEGDGRGLCKCCVWNELKEKHYECGASRTEV